MVIITANIHKSRHIALIMSNPYSFNITFPKKHIHNGTNNIISVPVFIDTVFNPVLYNNISIEYNIASNITIKICCLLFVEKMFLMQNGNKTIISTIQFKNTNSYKLTLNFAE